MTLTVRVMFVVPTTPLAIIITIIVLKSPSQNLRTHLSLNALLLLFSNPPFQTLEHTYP